MSWQLVLQAGDAVSGVATTEYRLDDGAWRLGDQIWLTARHKRGGLTVVSPGSHTIEYRSTDVAGNVETSHSCTVVIRASN